jgi:hypothetical protein
VTSRERRLPLRIMASGGAWMYGRDRSSAFLLPLKWSGRKQCQGPFYQHSHCSADSDHTLFPTTISATSPDNALRPFNLRRAFRARDYSPIRCRERMCAPWVANPTSLMATPPILDAAGPLAEAKKPTPTPRSIDSRCMRCYRSSSDGIVRPVCFDAMHNTLSFSVFSHTVNGQ